MTLQMNFACENSITVWSVGRVVKLGGPVNIYKIKSSLSLNGSPVA